MDTIRVAAKTVEDALTEASIQLCTSSDNIEYTVIDEGSKGFFGIGGRKAVIEAKKKFTDEDLMKEIFEDKPEKQKKEYKKEKKEYKEYKERKEGKKETKQDSRPIKKEARPVSEATRKETKPESGSEAESDDSLQNSREAGKDNKKEYRREYRKDQRRDSSREYRRNKNDSGEGKDPASQDKAEKEEQAVVLSDGQDFVNRAEKNAKRYRTEAVQQNPETEENPKAKVPADPEEAKRRAEEFLKEIFAAMEMQAEIKTSFEDDTLSVDLSGEDMGVLIGKRGQTLDSLQYLTSLVVNKGKASYVRVKLDTEDYRNRRKATLENLAKNIAFKVKKTGRPVFLEPMNPYERRIIHSALQNDPYVTTHSEGDEPYRKVVVTPRRDREYRGRRNWNGKYNDRRERTNRYSREEGYDYGKEAAEPEEQVVSDLAAEQSEE